MSLGDQVRAMLWFGRRGTHRVVLYGKPGCHLCDDARDLLDSLSARCAFTVDEVDITSDPALFRRYDIRIPVIVIDGVEEFDAPLQRDAVRRALR
jgi:glutaredoxin